MNIEEIRIFLRALNNEDIHFKRHFYEKTADRPVSESLVREYLKKTDRLLKAEVQPSKIKGEEKYKLWIRLSNRYSLVAVIVISGKDLYIITAWNKERKWERQR